MIFQLNESLDALVNWIAVFFHQYLWWKSIYLLDSLHGDNHQRKVPSEMTTFD